jgi:putative drug exporter of the RND superfamily
MHLSGRANWWLPGWLDRSLPHLSIEPATQPPAQPRDRQQPQPQAAVR